MSMKKCYWMKNTILVLTMIVYYGNCQVKHKPVVTHLYAKWNDTSLIQETAEYLAEENISTFWGFIQLIVENKTDFQKLGMCLYY